MLKTFFFLRAQRTHSRPHHALRKKKPRRQGKKKYTYTLHIRAVTVNAEQRDELAIVADYRGEITVMVDSRLKNTVHHSDGRLPRENLRTGKSHRMLRSGRKKTSERSSKRPLS